MEPATTDISSMDMVGSCCHKNIKMCSLIHVHLYICSEVLIFANQGYDSFTLI